MAFYAMLGQMSRMDLTQVRAVSGSSAGALVALLWIVTDCSIPDVLDFALGVKIDKLMKPNIKNFLNNFGLVPMNKIRHTLSDAIFKKFKTKEITFGELWSRRPIALHVSAFCTERGETVYFSHETHPGTSVLDAVCGSIAVPILFSTVKIGEWRYVDGGCQESAPGLPFVSKDPTEVVAICFGPAPLKGPSDSLASYVSSIFSGFLRLRHDYKFPTFMIEADDIDIFDFSADGLKIFAYGQKSRKILNDTHYPLGLHCPPHLQDDPREGGAVPQGVLVPPQGGLYPRETGSDLRRGGDRQGAEGDR
jgi:predicted acylesterase/phospholipase RssA